MRLEQPRQSSNAPSERREHRASPKNAFYAAFVAAALEACGGRSLYIPLGEVSLQIGTTSGAEGATSGSQQEQLPSAELTQVEERFGQLRERVFEVTDPETYTDPSQLPHLRGTNLLSLSYNQARTEVGITGGDQSHFDRMVRSLGGAVAYTQSHPDQALSVSYRVARARLEGGVSRPEEVGRTEVRIDAAPLTEAEQAVPQRPEGQLVFWTDLQRDNPRTRSVDEGCSGYGATEAQATAAAFAKLVTDVPRLIPTQTQVGTFGVENGSSGPTAYRLTYAHRIAEVYAAGLRTETEHLPSGDYRVHLLGRVRISAQADEQGEANSNRETTTPLRLTE